MNYKFTFLAGAGNNQRKEIKSNEGDSTGKLKMKRLS